MRIDDLASGAQTWASAFVSAALGGKTDQSLPDLLMYYPVAQVNPYQPMLYASAEKNSLSVLPLLRLESLDDIAWQGHGIVHLHWLASILQSASTEAEADAAVAGYAQRLGTMRRMGLRIVWTVHNVMPHTTKWVQAERAVRQATADAADLIHVMNRDTERLTSAHFRIDPRKVLHIPHPTYGDWYANVISPKHARQDLGLDPDSFTFLCFGSIQPYKGLLELIDAYDILCRRRADRACTLVIAGQVDNDDYYAALRARVADRMDVRLIPGNVRDQRVQYYFNSCDAVVAPYLETLNSGVAMLAATFRRMVVAPAEGGMAEVFADDPSLLYSRTATHGLASAMERALSYRPNESLFDSILARHDPYLLSDRFCSELRKMLEDGTVERQEC
ncbi:glycosyltransferase family 4 protein [Achromobacter sp. MYb9]|jgi:beta-1,4-mannosyltransferase|uniref:glycosyltransferase family 4 protein n=1 Tax=Achromobacter sp. MYb9 TaxID=1827284 RepID=UPI001304A769|nr:glycosyltransferase family 4 protein [Achromobacter sp. MYb9]